MFHPNEELGVTPPLGFWDPLGFSKFENPEATSETARGALYNLLEDAGC